MAAKMRKTMTFLALAAAHFALSNAILPLTNSLAAQSAGRPEGPGLAVVLLVRATRLLHLPLVTLALYPRQWFPGDWVYLPMAVDSVLWALLIVGLVRLFRKT
jgi:hypothetical protein